MTAFEGKKILVTGATGLVCSHLVEALMKNSVAKIYVLGRNLKKLQSVFGKYLDNKRIELIAQDVSAPIEIEEPLDYIFHGAGPIDSVTIREKPVDVIMPNIIGLLNCCKLAKSQNKKCTIVVFSSATVYENKKGEKVTEESSLQVVQLNDNNVAYSQSKIMQEILAKAMIRQYNLSIKIVRLSYVYGSSYFKPNTAFYQFLDTLKKGENIFMNNSGLPKRDNIFVDDAVSGLLTVAAKGTSGEVYNISSGGDGDNYAAIDEIAQIMITLYSEKHKNPVRLMYKSEVQERIDGLILDNSKLKKLGWSPKVSLTEGLRDVLKFYGVI